MQDPGSFWGELSPTTVRTPVAILRVQASKLGPMTRFAVEANVQTQTIGGYFYHTLTLVVPSMDNYEYELIKIRHDIGLYPVQDTSDYLQMENEEDFVEWLHRELASPKTKKILSNLLAMAE